jgi:hypothetical protein
LTPLLSLRWIVLVAVTLAGFLSLLSGLIATPGRGRKPKQAGGQNPDQISLAHGVFLRN